MLRLTRALPDYARSLCALLAGAKHSFTGRDSAKLIQGRRSVDQRNQPPISSHSAQQHPSSGQPIAPSSRQPVLLYLPLYSRLFSSPFLPWQELQLIERHQTIQPLFWPTALVELQQSSHGLQRTFYGVCGLVLRHHQQKMKWWPVLSLDFRELMRVVLGVGRYFRRLQALV